MRTMGLYSLPEDVRRAITEATTAVKNGTALRVHWSLEGYLPSPGRGQYYLEYNVGADRQGGAGRRRIALLVDGRRASNLPSADPPKRVERADGGYTYSRRDSGGARRIRRVFFTDDHYSRGSWVEVIFGGFGLG